MNSTHFARCLVLTAAFWGGLNAYAVPRHAGVVGNGGDGIECRPSADNDLNGFYSLDYLVTRAATHGDDGAGSVNSWKDSSERILRLLKTKVPTLASSFEDFSSQVFNTSYLYPRVWEAAPFGLAPLEDERLVSLIPANCLDANGKAQILQTVVRQFVSYSGTKPGIYIYKYAPQLIQRLDRQSPLQLSHLMVHEWLWEVSTNVDRNRRVNRFLHSREFEKMSPEEAAVTLRGMGVPIPDSIQEGFESERWQGYELDEKAYYERFPTGGLRNLGPLKIEMRQREENCEPGNIYCAPEWRAPSYIPHVFSDNRFFLSPGWDGNGDRQWPLKILSPDILRQQQRRVTASNAQFFCRFVEDGEFNLECKVNDPELFGVFGIRDERPIEKWPVVKAKITEEYFRMVIRVRGQIDGVRGPDGTSVTIERTTETALTTRFKLPTPVACNSDLT